VDRRLLFYPRFSIYKHQLVLKDNRLISRQFIVLKSKDKRIVFTDFHRFIKSGNQTIRNISDDSNNRFNFVVMMLNYVFFHENCKSLDELTIGMLKNFLNKYGRGTLPCDEDTTGRTKSTVKKCVNTILDFVELIIRERENKCLISIEDLYKFVPYRDKRGITREKKVPIFDVLYVDKKNEIFRDIPNSAFEMLFNHIANYHKDLLMLVSLTAFAGLRPSEACNVRREDSPLGSGLIFDIYDDEIQKVQIDIRKELCLRSDLLVTGRIKKERLQTIPFIFTDIFSDSYVKYMEHIEGRKYEKDYGALTINNQGKAMTYNSYYKKFRKIVKEEIIPLFLYCEDPEVVLYGRLLLENNLSPHVFRHWYTVQLVLSGMDNVAELMNARGDSSPMSSLVYLQNKGELEKQYRKVNNEMFDYLSWAANKQWKGEQTFD
jgi:integrase